MFHPGNFFSPVRRTIAFAWKYSQKASGRKIWLLLFYRAYQSIQPLVIAFFLKLLLDCLSRVNQIPPALLLKEAFLLLFAYFLVDCWHNFYFRHAAVLSKVLQRKLLSEIEIDLAFKNASLPIATIEDAGFKDKYSLVKNEAGFRLFPIVEQSVSLVAGFFSFVFIAFLISRSGFWYLFLLLAVQIPRILLIKPALNKIVGRATLNAKLSRYWSLYLSFLQNVRDAYEARILRIKDFVKKRLLSLQEQTVGFFEKTENELLGPRVATAVLPMMGVFTISFLTIRKVVSGLVSLGDWQLTVAACQRFTDLGKELIDDFGSLKEAQVFILQLEEILNLPDAAEKKEKIKVGKINCLEFKNVYFKYPHAKNYVLKNISFKIGEHENIALVGHNGAGKTTLVKLICRFYRPTKGDIFLNGFSLEEYSLDDYWQAMSVLFQDFGTYGLSAQESIGFGDIDRLENQKRITKVAGLVGINKYLLSLPRGYQTPLICDLESGVNLSTGQWQKVALARALFRQSGLIILDEPTSNLDPESEEEIFNKLIRTVQKRIMILISHRFSTVKRADRILVIDSGRLVEEGSHLGLMAKKGLYAKLFKIQSESYRK